MDSSSWSVIKDCSIPSVIASVLASGGGTPSAADTTLPRDGVTRGGKSGRRSGAGRGVRTLNSFNWATSSAVNNARSPGKPGKMGSTARKDPTVQNGASCPIAESINRPAWLCGTTSSRNSLGPYCTPHGIRRRPPLVRFLSDGSQFSTDNSRLTIILSDTMTYEWFSGSQGVILEGSLSRYSAAYATQ